MTLFKTLIKDHDTQRDLLERLMRTRGDSEERETLFKKARLELVSHAAAEKLQKAVTHHLDEEEEKVFQMADKVIDDDHQAELDRLYREEMADSR